MCGAVKQFWCPVQAPTDQDLEAGNFKVGGQIGIGGDFPHVAQPGPEQGPGMPAQTVP